MRPAWLTWYTCRTDTALMLWNDSNESFHFQNGTQPITAPLLCQSKTRC